MQFASRNDAPRALAANLSGMRTPIVDRAKLAAVLNAVHGPAAKSESKAFEEKWRALQQQLADARPAEQSASKSASSNRCAARFAEADLDTAVFAQAASDPHLDAGLIRVCDQLLHPTPQTLPRTPQTLRLRELADLAMRVEVHAWPRDLVDAFLRCTQLGENAQREFPYLPGFVDRLIEPMQARHDGEVRLLTPGYSNTDEAKKILNAAADQFAALIEVNERWRASEKALDEALADLPWYFEALEAMPELRDAWVSAASAAADLAAALEQTPTGDGWWLKIETQRSQAARADGAIQQMSVALNVLHEPFRKNALARLEEECRSPKADARVLRRAEGMLSVASPILAAEQRAAIWKSALGLSRRLNDEIIALDRQDNEQRRHAARSRTQAGRGRRSPASRLAGPLPARASGFGGHRRRALAAIAAETRGARRKSAIRSDGADSAPASARSSARICRRFTNRRRRGAAANGSPG